MTDKEFLSWIYDLMIYKYGENENVDYLHRFKRIIDSLQDEPEPQFKVGDIIRSKVWELAVHEIVSMDDSAYYFENGGKVEIANQKLWELAEEPVSEDLEEAAKNHAAERYRVTRDRELAEKCKWSFKAGAKWQEEKDNEEKVLTYKHGFEDCKKQVSEDSKKELPKVWDRETLDEYAYQVAYDLSNDWMRETATWDDVETAVKLGAKWQKEHLWKPADGDDLPEIDREVIVLTQNYPLEGSEYAVSFAHRPYKGKYIGKSLTTGNIETFENKTYDKGGWNIPDVKWWLDCGWPNEEE